MTTMKGTEHFKQAIKAYLDKQAESDPLFAPHYSKPEKSIDKCVEYIVGEVFHSGCNGFDDQSVYAGLSIILRRTMWKFVKSLITALAMP